MFGRPWRWWVVSSCQCRWEKITGLMGWRVVRGCGAFACAAQLRKKARAVLVQQCSAAVQCSSAASCEATAELAAATSVFQCPATEVYSPESEGCGYFLELRAVYSIMRRLYVAHHHGQRAEACMHLITGLITARYPVWRHTFSSLYNSSIALLKKTPLSSFTPPTLHHGTCKMSLVVDDILHVCTIQTSKRGRSCTADDVMIAKSWWIYVSSAGEHTSPHL